MSDAPARRVLACYHARIPSTVIRLERPLTAWARQTGGALRLVPEHRVGDGDVLWADAVVLARPATLFAERVARLARRWRRPLIVDLDDHLLAIPEGSAAAAFHGQPSTRRRLTRLLRRAEAAVLSTERLREAAAPLCRRAEVIGNSVPPIIEGPRPENPSGEIVALLATSDRLDCPSLRAALPAIFDAIPQFTLLCIGDALAELDHPRVRRLPAMPHEAYLACLAREPINFALVPLARSPFNDCKSAIKWLDGAALGIPGLFSRVPAYEAVAGEGRGVLVDNTAEAWGDAILWAAGHPGEMCAIAQMAREFALREHTPERAAGRWEALLASLPRPTRPASRAPGTLRVAVFTPEPVREQFTGPNLRAVAMARELACEFDVTLAVPQATDLLRGESFAVEAIPRGAAGHSLPRFAVAVSTGLAYPASALVRQRAVQVIDLCDPVLLELAAGEDGGGIADGHAVRFLRRMTRLLLMTGDHFLCASERQRDLWLGALYLSGRRAALRAPEALISVVPFGASVSISSGARRVLRRVAPGIAEGDRVLVWSGGLWDWFDPLTLLRAVAEIAARRSDVKLVFLGTRPGGDSAHGEAMQGRARALAAELGLLGRTVLFHEGWLGLGELGDALAAADLAVCTAPATTENRFSVRTRLADAVAARLPIVCTRGSALADFVEMREIGLTAAPGDAADLAAKIVAALEPQRQQQFRGNLALCGEAMRWERCLEPLRVLCRRVADGDLVRVRESAAVRWARFARYKLPCLADRLWPW